MHSVGFVERDRSSSEWSKACGDLSIRPVLVSPEYNASMPGILKNVIEWTSRFKPPPFTRRYGMLMSASPSMAGGNRGLWSLRIPLEHLGARVYRDMFSLARCTRHSPATVASPTRRY